MRSKIYAGDITTNRDRRSAEAAAYYPAELVQPDGERLPLLFTPSDIAQALARGKRNPEDFTALSAGRCRWVGGLARSVAIGSAVGIIAGVVWLSLVL